MTIETKEPMFENGRLLIIAVLCSSLAVLSVLNWLID